MEGEGLGNLFTWSAAQPSYVVTHPYNSHWYMRLILHSVLP